jgi:hypothetical protein
MGICFSTGLELAWAGVAIEGETPQNCPPDVTRGKTLSGCSVNVDNDAPIRGENWLAVIRQLQNNVSTYGSRGDIDRSRFGWDNPTMIVTLDAKRRVSIPAALAPAAPGDQFDASFDAEEDVVVLRRIKRKPDWLQVWRQCPVAMDDLPERSRERPRRAKL